MNLAPPDPPIASTATPTFLRLERGYLRQKLAQATNYAQWIEAAQAFDTVTGRERWKQRRRSGLYDHAMIGEKQDRLRELLQRGDSRGLMFEIEEGVHGNLGGMGKPILHNKAQFGTKQLITDYVAAVADTLTHLEAVDDPMIPVATKLDLFRRASHCYGRTALMMSSGGMLMFFHFGVAKSLFEQGVLPNVISGSSAGAIVAAVLGTRTDAELDGFFKPENLYFGEAWSPNKLEQFTGLRRIFGTDSFERTFDRLIPDLTFREAFERSGRNISISVSPCERHQTPRLLNAVTSPHVLIRSAVRASCAVPGLFEPVQLLARDQNGQTVRSSNRDGSTACSHARRRAPDLAAHRDDPHLVADQPHAGWNPGATRPPVARTKSGIALLIRRKAPDFTRATDRLEPGKRTYGLRAAHFTSSSFPFLPEGRSA